MHLHSCFLTGNDCYKAGRTIIPKGVMVHSTGANNPSLKRYVQPDDGLIGENTNGNDWNRPGVGACVHAFIGKLKDGTIATYQTLPWTMRGWHCGDNGNNTHISFEICEDYLSDDAYFATVYQEAVELTTYLCKQFDLDPLADGVVICHQEGYQRGIASNHGDVLHWFPKHGKTMDDFRKDVAKKMEETMTYEHFCEFMARYVNERAAKPVSSWANQDHVWDNLVDEGIFDGTKPQAPLTRQEAAILIDRMRKEG